MKKSEVGYLRKYKSFWYLIPSDKVKEWEAYMEILYDLRHPHWLLFTNQFENDFRKYVLNKALEDLRILL